MKLHLREDLTKSDLDIIYKKVYNEFVENSNALGFQKDLVTHKLIKTYKNLL